MDHRDFVARLDAETRAALTEKSDEAGLQQLVNHGVVIFVFGLCVALVPGPFWALFMLPLGIALTFLFTLEHEATHKTPFASERLNDGVGRVCGVILLLPFEWFRYFHLAHHRWTNLPGQDPELEGGKPQTRLAWAWHVSGLPYWIAEVRLLAALVRGRGMAKYVPAAARGRVVREARWMVAVYGAASLSLFWSDAVLWFWMVPMLLGQPFLRLYLLAEHGDCPQVANMFENTRTTFTTAVVRLLAWNMPYHVEHHVMPQVPFYRLPALHRLMREELRVTAAGYAAFTREYLARR
jgi:fatty acid desaturase